MDDLRVTARRVLALVRRHQLDDELAEEIRSHIEMRRRALIADGMDPREAAWEARRMFGNVTAIREETRDMWGFPSFDTLAQDLRYGARMLRRSPVFTLTAVLSLGIGIGAAAAVFSLANTVLFRRLPVSAPDRLVVLRWVSSGRLPFESLSGYASQVGTEAASTSFSLAAFEGVRREAAPYADTMGFADLYRVNVALDGRPETAYGQVVSGNYFSVLGVPPATGRAIAGSDDTADAPLVAMISYDYWQRRFGGAADAIGRSLVVNNLTFSIIGVTAPGFHGTLQVGQGPDVTLPMASYGAVTRGDDPNSPNFWWVLMMARLKPGATVGQMQPVIDAVVKQSVRAAQPTLEPRDLPRVVAEPGAAGQTEDRKRMREPLTAMAFVVAIVLLVACVNVANLLLARGRSRVREVAVRVAIGAPRRRIIRQLLTEGILLAALGSALGLAMANWIAAALMPALVARGSSGIRLEVSVDWRVLAFTVLLASVCSILFGLAPSLRATDVRVAAGLQETTRGAVGSHQRTRLGGSLVVVQVALSMLLLCAAGLLANSVRNLQRVDPGFDPHNLLIFSVDPQQNGYDETRARQTLEGALERLRAIPGVQAASLSSHRLISNSSSIGVAARADETRPAPGAEGAQGFMEQHSAWRLVVDDSFLDTMGIRVLRGRALSPADSKGAPPSAVINEALAQQLFGTTDVVGRQFFIGLRASAPIQVVGVAANACYTSLRREPPPTAYLSYRQRPIESATFEVRTSGDAKAMAPAIREAMRQVDATLPLVNLRTQDDQIVESLTEERLFAALATLLGAVTLLLSSIGVYGLLAYSVARRTQEIGVRMALGAERSMVRWMILRQSLILTVAGVLLGIPAAVFGARVIEAMLYGLTPRDPLTVASAALVMTMASLAAAHFPARRASRVDPIVALRTE